jgi:hypothetical protein
MPVNWKAGTSAMTNKSERSTGEQLGGKSKIASLKRLKMHLCLRKCGRNRNPLSGKPEITVLVEPFLSGTEDNNQDEIQKSLL